MEKDETQLLDIFGERSQGYVEVWDLVVIPAARKKSPVVVELKSSHQLGCYDLLVNDVRVLFSATIPYAKKQHKSLKTGLKHRGFLVI